MTAGTSGLPPGDKLNAIDPASGEPLRSIEVAARAGTAFDGQHLFQIADGRIQKIDPKSGRVLATIPSPGGGDSGLAWAEGSFWVGQYRDFCNRHLRFRSVTVPSPQTGLRMVCGVCPKVKPSQSICN